MWQMTQINPRVLNSAALIVIVHNDVFFTCCRLFTRSLMDGGPTARFNTLVIHFMRKRDKEKHVSGCFLWVGTIWISFKLFLAFMGAFKPRHWNPSSFADPGRINVKAHRIDMVVTFDGKEKSRKGVSGTETQKFISIIIFRSHKSFSCPYQLL